MAMMIGHGASVTAPGGPSPRVLVRVETDACVYVGYLGIAEGTYQVSDVLADDRQFLSLTDVRINEGGQIGYLAVNKRLIRTLRLLDETRSGAMARRPRAEPAAC